LTTFVYAATVAVVFFVAGCTPVRNQPPGDSCDASCAGCCQDGVCVALSDETDQLCGAGGTACFSCSGDTSCAGGLCISPTVDLGDGSCVPQTDKKFCTAQAATCGTVSAVDNCGGHRAVNCGVCAGNTTCGGGGTPHQCSCAAETNFAFCGRQGAGCGSVTAADNCGASRTVDCGTCGAPQVCTAGQCVCTPETDAQLCTANARACGSFTVKDKCGTTRTVATCGSCASGNSCSAGVCSCSTSESSYSFCYRLGASCGAVTGTDLCGNPKSVASCGTCSSYQTCGGAGTANVCGCTPQSNADFCTAKGKNCGSVSNYDNCGSYRTVADCGTCTSPQTCGANSNPGVCSCAAETNAQFCTRLGKNCDSVTAADNCGTPRTAACGTTCPAGQTCGGGGSANVCGCTAETSAQLCSKYTMSCGPFSAVDSCGVSRTLDCGSCAAGKLCGANGLTGQCGAVATFSSVQTGTHPVSLAPLYIDSGINAIRAVSPTEIWLASPKNLVRIQGSTVRPYYLDGLTTYGPSRLWSSSPNDVWFASNGLLFHFDGSSWTSVNAGFAANPSFTAIFGTASDDIWVATSTPEIRHFDGTNWTTWAVPAGSGAVDSIAGSTRGMPYVSRGDVVYRWNGLSYATLPDYPGHYYGPHRIWVSPTGTLFVGSNECSYSYNSQYLDRYNGSTWTTLYTSSTSYSSYCTYPDAFSLDGTSDTNVWWGDGWGSVHRYTGTTTLTTLTGSMVSVTGATTGFTADKQHLYELVNNRSVTRFDTGTAQGCDNAYSDGGGGAWLRCDNGLGRFDAGGAFSLTPQTDLAAMFSSPTTSLWIAHTTGAIEQRKSTGTTTFNDYLGSKLVAMSGSSDSNMWAVTPEGGAAHFDGSHFTTSMIPIGSTDKIVGVGASATTAWAWGQKSLFQWNGTTWAQVALPNTSLSIIRMLIYADQPWLISYEYPANPSTNLYSRSGTTWKVQRATPSLAWGYSPSGILTLTVNSTTGVGTLERWQEAGATTLTTFKSATYNANESVTMPSAGVVLFSNGTNTYVGRY